MVNLPILAHTCKKVVLMLILGEVLVVATLYYSGYSVSSAMNTVYHQNLANMSGPALIYGLINSGKTTGLTNSSRTVTQTNHSILADIHLEGPGHQHTFQQDILVNSSTPGSIYKAIVSIGMGLTTRKVPGLDQNNLDKTLAFFKSFLPSFCRTASSGYSYPFFIAYDYNDQFLIKKNFLLSFTTKFTEYVSANCPKGLSVSLHFVVCSHTMKPAWAQNDAMLEAYTSGSDYFYRINDDTIMETNGWTEKFISTLNDFSPSLVGVTGPKHKGGNTAILTYDFTHRTHLEVFGFYYPREFPDWFGDRWITDVYKPGRSIKRPDVRLRHTMETGQRYSQTKRGYLLKAQLAKDTETVKSYVMAKEKGFVAPQPDKVISLTLLKNDSAQMWGAIRNAQLLPVVYPGWTLRIYIPRVNTSQHDVAEQAMALPQNVKDTLRRLGVQLIEVSTSHVPHEALSHLVADDPSVNMFLIRRADCRITEREATAISAWLKTDDTSHILHSIRDHVSHKTHNIMAGTWGARAQALRNLLGQGVTMETLLQGHYKQFNTKPSKDQESFSQTFLDEVLWEKVRSVTLCHDSVSCDRGVPGVIPFPVPRQGYVYVGQTYDGHEQATDSQKDLSLSANRTAKCDGIPA